MFFNQAMIKLTEEGFIDLLKVKYFKDQNQQDITNKQGTPLGFQKLVSIFVMLTSGMAIATTFLLFEKVAPPTPHPARSTQKMRKARTDAEVVDALKIGLAILEMTSNTNCELKRQISDLKRTIAQHNIENFCEKSKLLGVIEAGAFIRDVVEYTRTRT